LEHLFRRFPYGYLTPPPIQIMVYFVVVVVCPRRRAFNGDSY